MKRRWSVAMLMAAVCGIVKLVKADEPSPTVRLPEVTVTEKALNEELPVGPNQEPKWTTDGRLGGTVRSYVKPPWDVEFTHWWNPVSRRGENTEHQFFEELELGLPYRFQLDLYEVSLLSD